MPDYSTKNDAELVLCLKEGSEAAFTEIYNRYWHRLYSLVYQKLKDTAAAEEVVQEVFLALWKKKGALHIQSLPVYLAAMARYAVYHYVAKEKQVQENRQGWKKNQALSVDAAEALENKLLLEIIETLSNDLPEKCRLVFQYNKLEDRSLNEVSEALGISPKTAEAHLTKALRIIRNRFGKGLYSFFL